MTTTEISKAGITELTLRLVLVEYSTIPVYFAEGQAIKAELQRRKGR